ncbi:hypothetical protein PMAYCL1PPCAC_19138, partial [Pristionchus mayeri]
GDPIVEGNRRGLVCYRDMSSTEDGTYDGLRLGTLQRRHRLLDVGRAIGGDGRVSILLRDGEGHLCSGLLRLGAFEGDLEVALRLQLISDELHCLLRVSHSLPVHVKDDVTDCCAQRPEALRLDRSDVHPIVESLHCDAECHSLKAVDHRHLVLVIVSSFSLFEWWFLCRVVAQSNVRERNYLAGFFLEGIHKLEVWLGHDLIVDSQHDVTDPTESPKHAVVFNVDDEPAFHCEIDLEWFLVIDCEFVGHLHVEVGGNFGVLLERLMEGVRDQLLFVDHCGGKGRERRRGARDRPERRR